MKLKDKSVKFQMEASSIIEVIGFKGVHIYIRVPWQSLSGFHNRDSPSEIIIITGL